MAARQLDAYRLVLPAGLAGLAAIVGLAAGIAPSVAVAMALAVAFALLAITDLAAGIVVFTFLSFLELFPSVTGPAVSVAKLAGIVLAISFLANTSSRGERREFPAAHRTLTALLFLYIAWNLVSALWAEEPSRVIVYTMSFVLDFALFPIVYLAVRTITDVRRILIAFIIGAGAAAVYGVIAQPDATALATSPDATSGLNRLAGTIGDPNELAALLVAGIALTPVLIFGPRRPALVRLFGVAAAGVLLLTTLLTVSRGGLVALAALVVTGVIVAGRHRGQALLAAAVVVTCGLVFYFAYASPGARDRISTSDGGSGRTDIWKVGWRMIEAEPLVGVGAANFQNTSIHYVLEPGVIKVNSIVDTPSVAHNAYLQVLAETGIVGLTMYLAILVISIGALARAARNFNRRDDREGLIVTQAVIIAVAALLAGYFFLSEERGKELWLLLSLGPALLAISQQSDSERA